MRKHQPYEYKMFCFLRKKHNNCNSSLLKIPKIFNQKFPRFSIFGVKYLLLFRYFSIIDSFYSIVLKIGINHVIALVAGLVEEP